MKISFTFLRTLTLSFISDGQAIATKLSKQITRRTNSMKSAIAKYNASLKSLEDWVEGLPNEIDFDEAKEPDSQLYSALNMDTVQDSVPFTVKRSAIDLHNFLERCKEEQELLDTEVEKLISHYESKREELELFITEHSGISTKVIKGAMSVFRKNIVNVNNTLYSLGSALSDYLPEETKRRLPTVKIVAEHALSQVFSTESFENIPVDETNVGDDECDNESLHFSDEEDSDFADE